LVDQDACSVAPVECVTADMGPSVDYQNGLTASFASCSAITDPANPAPAGRGRLLPPLADAIARFVRDRPRPLTSAATASSREDNLSL
jgi:hypothetical protein